MDRKAKAGERLAIGRLGAPRGVRGELRIHSYSGEFEHFLGLKEVLLVPGVKLPEAKQAGGKASSAAAPRPGQAAPRSSVPRTELRLRVLKVEEGAGGLGMIFEGYGSPEAARALTGMDIVVDREAASPLRDNEWYIADLVGLDLVEAGSPPGSQPLAKVQSVLSGGPDPWLESRLPDGRLALVPFRKEFVGEIDLESGRIELLAPWLLEP